MPLGLDISPLARVVVALAGGTTPREWFHQIAVAAGALFAAWAFARIACARVKVSPKWKFGEGDFEGVVFPALAWLFAWIGKSALERFESPDFLEIVLTLIAALAVIRVAAYVLRHVVPASALQRAVIRVVTWTAWIVAVLYVAGLLPEVVAALDAHGFSIGKGKPAITILDLLKGATALFLSITLALYLSRVTESRVLSSDSMEMTTRVVIAKAVRVATLFIAIFIALPLAGIDVTTLSVFTGALGVGLAFGLQKITSNYVSGFIVLLDRSLRIGDVVSVDGRRGEVTAIETRYTVIKGGDGVESIIPNEKMITEIVNHHTYSDSRVSVAMSVTISYDSDVDRAFELLVASARKQARVIADPPAIARVKQLSDRGVELELTVWISDPVAGEGDLRSELLKDVLRAFRTGGIEIAFPRREVRLIATDETGETPSPPSA
ncbi:MAG TPA: mechanosensitive ion channel domain-containing protein [Usitatibacter sp.]